jgi:hypothetical protein
MNFANGEPEMTKKELETYFQKKENDVYIVAIESAEKRARLMFFLDKIGWNYEAIENKIIIKNPYGF